MEQKWKSQFREWLKEICPWDKIEEHVQFHGQVLPSLNKDEVRIVDSSWGRRAKERDEIAILIFTRERYYAIRASEKYLGCTTSPRKPKAGFTWTGGHDLPDGKFCRATWERIKNAIIRNEMVKVVKFPKRTPDGGIEGPSIE